MKVLDFGLAKAMEPAVGASPGVSQSPTLTSPAVMTGAGVILGTAAYMSPEQARGKPVDTRTDIWAFGCVVYEMLTGRRAFEGQTVTDALAAIIEREPAWGLLPASTPSGVRRLLRRCLVKDQKRRLHDIVDARLELDEALAEPGGDEVKSASSRPARGGIVVGARACRDRHRCRDDRVACCPAHALGGECRSVGGSEARAAHL